MKMILAIVHFIIFSSLINFSLIDPALALTVSKSCGMDGHERCPKPGESQESYDDYVETRSKPVPYFSKSCGMPGKERCPKKGETKGSYDDYLEARSKPVPYFSKSCGMPGKERCPKKGETKGSYDDYLETRSKPVAYFSKSCGMPGNERCPTLGETQESYDNYLASRSEPVAIDSNSCGMPGNPPCPRTEQSKESYKGCRFNQEGYKILTYSPQFEARCLCTNKIPDLCQATVFCDGSDRSTGYGEAITTCSQVNGECPSLKGCIEDKTMDNPRFDLDNYKKAVDALSTSGTVSK